MQQRDAVSTEMTDLARVFVSSVMSGFEPYRAAARAGIIDAGMKPILIEDFPSLDTSSRSACLDLVQSSDVYVVVIGDRPGSSPLGKPVVEEEFEEARRRKLPRLMFVQNVQRDSETEALINRLSDFVLGRFRTTFDSPDDLRLAIATALKGLSAMNIEKNDPSLIHELLDTRVDDRTALLRLAFVPERKDEVFDALDFDATELRRSLFQLAHRDDVRLFDFEQGAKHATVEGSDLVLRQDAVRGSGPEIGVTVRMREDGAVVIDQTIAGRTKNSHQLGLDFQIAESDVVEAIRSGIAFVNALYDERDRGHRFATFLFGAAVAGMNMQVIVKERRQQSSWSFPNYDDRGWSPLDKPRRLDRTDLATPAGTVDRTLAFIVKRYGAQT
jgi:Domain of unknown function (DUF4062)